MGKGLSTYLAPLRKRLLLKVEASILCRSPEQGIWRLMREQGWANQLLPHPTPGAQDWRLQRVGPVWPPSMGGECSNGDMRGLGLSPYQEATEGPSAGALVQVGRLCRHSALSPIHPRRRPPCSSASALTKALGAQGSLGTGKSSKVAASSRAVPKGTEVNFHGQSVLLACKVFLAKAAPELMVCRLPAGPKGRLDYSGPGHSLLGGGAHSGWDPWNRERGGP